MKTKKNENFAKYFRGSIEPGPTHRDTANQTLRI